MNAHPAPPRAADLSYAQYSGWACCWCGTSLRHRGGVSAGRAEGSSGAHDLSIEVYECGPHCPDRPQPGTPSPKAGDTT